MSITIKNGQFIDESGKVVKPEFGNREHILAIKKEEIRLKDLEKGIPCEVDFNEVITYDMVVYFNCGKCQKRLYKDFEGLDSEDDRELKIADKKICICRDCKTEHRLVYNKADNEIRAVVEK